MTRPDPRLILVLVALTGSLILVVTPPRAGSDLTAASPRQRPAVASPTVRASDPAPGGVPTPVLPAASPVGTAPPAFTASGPVPVESPAAAASLRGTSSWYAYVAGQAAAGPALRRALGDSWRGTVVVVSAGERMVRVRLTDWCQCYAGTATERIIDLDRRDFAVLAAPSRGLVPVVVTIE